MCSLPQKLKSWHQMGCGRSRPWQWILASWSQTVLWKGLGPGNQAGLTDPKATALLGTGEGPSVYLHFDFESPGCGRWVKAVVIGCCQWLNLNIFTLTFYPYLRRKGARNLSAEKININFQMENKWTLGKNTDISTTVAYGIFKMQMIKVSHSNLF